MGLDLGAAVSLLSSGLRKSTITEDTWGAGSPSFGVESKVTPPSGRIFPWESWSRIRVIQRKGIETLGSVPSKGTQIWTPDVLALSLLESSSLDVVGRRCPDAAG